MNNTIKHLIIGYGQIGKAVAKVLLNHYINVSHIDIGEKVEGKFDVLHFCFPYSEGFIQTVKDYQAQYLDSYGISIVHATVAIGTCDRLMAVSSPVRGKHPDLAEGILLFEKAFGGAGAQRAADIFHKCGVKRVRVDSDARSVEAFKLFDTLQYGLAVMHMLKIHKYCLDNHLNFDTVYSWANETYNDGYEKLDLPQYKKYVLNPMPGKIGGHCVIPNAEILKDFDLARQLLNFNANL